MSNKNDDKISAIGQNSMDDYVTINKNSNYSKTPLNAFIERYNKNILPIISNKDFINNYVIQNRAIDSFISQIGNYSNVILNGMSSFINDTNLFGYISDYLKKYQSISKSFLEVLKVLSTSRLTKEDSIILNKYYWVIPFEYDYLKLTKLKKYKTRANFEKYMSKYFTIKRTKKLFYKTRKQFNENDKKVLLRQIEESYFNGNYAICITSLMTLFDSSTMTLLEPNCDNQHASYKVINAMLDFFSEDSDSGFGCEFYLKVDILNNFIGKLYVNVTYLKESRRKLLLSRHLNSHGIRYLNDKINVLRLLNALYYCNLVIEQAGLNEQFKKDGKKFVIK